MTIYPRGIEPELLVSQVRNTMPYLFESEAPAETADFPPIGFVLKAAQDRGRELSHFEYFRLCLSAHYLTCATPVPTDVDNQIRRKLWPKDLPLEFALQMSELVLQSRGWNFTRVSSRWVCGAPGGAWATEALSGHLGEWFTVAAGAYCALLQYRAADARTQAQRLFDAVGDEVQRHSDIFGSLWRENLGIEALKASAQIAHNLGDLDRVMEMWDLSLLDPFRRFEKLGSVPFDSERNLRFAGRLWVAGELYKAAVGTSGMTFENHRHFALRKPRCLRTRAAFRVPIGPFFDDWGRTAAKLLSESDLREVAEALQQGWVRLPKTVGYGRALRAIDLEWPSLKLNQELLKNSTFRSVLEQPQDRFEKKWNEEALRHLDEIPGRAG